MMHYIQGVAVWTIMLFALAKITGPMCCKNGWLPKDYHNPVAHRNTVLTACVPVLRGFVAFLLIFAALVPKDKLTGK